MGKLNGSTKYLMAGVVVSLAFVGYMVRNDLMRSEGDEHLQKEVTRIELVQTKQYGEIQTSLMQIKTKLGIDEPIGGRDGV